MHIVTLTEVGNAFYVAIPAALRRQLGFVKTDQFIFRRYSSRAVIFEKLTATAIVNIQRRSKNSRRNGSKPE